MKLPNGNTSTSPLSNRGGRGRTRKRSKRKTG